MKTGLEAILHTQEVNEEWMCYLSAISQFEPQMINFHTCAVCSLFIQLKAVIADATKHSRHVFTTAMYTQGKHSTLVNICRERNGAEFS